MSYPAAMQALVDQFGNQDAIAQKIVQVGSFQPYDLVRVHSNPSTSVLTNAHEGSVATSTVVLLTDGQARAGLKFKPDTSVIRNRNNQQLHLIIASSIDQTITVEFEDYPAKEVQVTANQPALFSIGMLFEIPVIASTASFFDVATGGDSGSNSSKPLHPFNFFNCALNNNQLTYTGGINAAGAPALSIQKTIEIGQSVKVWLNPATYKTVTLSIDNDTNGGNGTVQDHAATLYQSQDPLAGTSSVQLLDGRSSGTDHLPLDAVPNGFFGKITRVAEGVIRVSIENESGHTLKELTVDRTGLALANFWLEITFNSVSDAFTAALEAA